MVMDLNELANKVSELCLNFYNNKLPNAKRLMKENEWTILSAFVIDYDGKFNVCSMGTGTKCIGSMMLSENGDILNDSHAEIIARRAFIRYLMNQIVKTKSTDESAVTSIFELNEKSKKFHLKENVRFHMFTTSSPCGDGSIFATSDHRTDEPEAKKIRINDNSSNLPNGFTGAKLMFDEDVEDPMEQTPGKIRIKPGKGDRTFSLSCSDKIARWNMLGVQGSMLSTIIEPIYLKSIILADGTPFNQASMERALYKRFLDVDKHLSLPFKHHHPDVIIATNKMKFQYARNDNDRVNPSSNSIIYCQVDEKER